MGGALAVLYSTCICCNIHLQQFFYKFIWGVYIQYCLCGLQEIVDGGMVESCKEGVDTILSVLVSILETPNYSDGTSSITSCLSRTYKALSALSDIHLFHTYPAV